MAVGLVSREPAAQLEERLLTARKASENNDDGWFDLLVDIVGDGETTPMPLFQVREVRPSGNLSTGQVIVYCETRQGSKVEIIFPKQSDREIGLADIQIQDD